MSLRRGGWLVAAGLAGLQVQAQAPAWQAPQEERARPNPVAASDEALKKGRALYQRNCAMCHGDRGKGDGPAARMHAQRASRAPQDLTDAAVQREMSDGEIFWKISTGLREDGKIVMPSFQEDIPKPEDRWKLVLFVRSFAPDR